MIRFFYDPSLPAALRLFSLTPAEDVAIYDSINISYLKVPMIATTITPYRLPDGAYDQT